MEKRNYNIDILKTIGLFGIILAHVCTNQIIMQLRGFDVTMLVLLSGYLSVQSLKKIKYIEYVKKRFNRLILPTWIFLTLIFAGGGLLHYFFILIILLHLDKFFEVIF